MTLSDLQLKKLTPKKARFEVSDGKGLSVRVMPTGKKTWVFRYMIEGTARRMTLGTYPAMSLAEAREKHSLAMQDVERGIDPGHKKQAEKAARKAAPAVADLLDEFWDIELKHKATGQERKRLVVKDALPVWGNRKVGDITRRDAVLLVDGVRERAPITANRLQSVLVRMFNFAAERGIIEHSPLSGMKKKPEQARSRVLNDDEIRLLWNALDLANITIDLFHVSKLALKMILLTGQRPGEVCGMTWAEIDQEGFWNIPAERRKGRVSQRVPLSGMALEIIEQARIYSGESRFVFASSHKDDCHLMTHTLSKAIIRHWQEIGFKEPFTPHDLRRTLRTRLAEIGIDDVVAESVLGHKLQGIMAVYNRHSYDVEKRQALEKWEKKLRRIIGIDELEATGKVIEFRKLRYGGK
jgi:integrase